MLRSHHINDLVSTELTVRAKKNKIRWNIRVFLKDKFKTEAVPKGAEGATPLVAGLPPLAPNEFFWLDDCNWTSWMQI